MMDLSQKHAMAKVAVLVAGLLLLATPPASGYQPIDDLIATVTEFSKSGEITDATVEANLKTSLETIGTLIDGEQKVTAKSLLTVFVQDVTAQKGATVSDTAANRLIDGANSIAATL